MKRVLPPRAGGRRRRHGRARRSSGAPARGGHFGWWAPRNADHEAPSSGAGAVNVEGCGVIGLWRGPIGKSMKRRLNLSGSWQQGHSTAYNTAFRPSRLQGIYPQWNEWNCHARAGEPDTVGYAPGRGRAAPICSRVRSLGKVTPLLARLPA